MTTFQKRMCTIFALLALVIVISACSSPTGPSNTGNGNGGTTPQFGTVTVQFKQTTVSSCQAVGTVFCDPTNDIGKIHANVSWIDPTIGATGGTVTKSSDPVSPNADGSATMVISGLPKGIMTIEVVNPWLCPNAKGLCSVALTGRGITANGVVLNDGPTQTTFSFLPPDVVSK